MVRNAVRNHLRRLITVLGLPLVAFSAVIALTGTPALASYTNMGTYFLSDGGFCFGVLSGGTADKTPIVLGGCRLDVAYTQWTIYWVAPDGYYQLQPHHAEWPTNKCMDGPDSSPVVYIYGCHGGHQQQWLLSPGTSGPQQIRQKGTNNCLSEHTPLGAGYVTAERVNCSLNPLWQLIRIA